MLVYLENDKKEITQIDSREVFEIIQEGLGVISVKGPEILYGKFFFSKGSIVGPTPTTKDSLFGKAFGDAHGKLSKAEIHDRFDILYGIQEGYYA